MNANCSRGLRACLTGITLASGLLAPAIVRAEVGVATGSGGNVAVLAYVMETSEDPTPITGIVWRKLGLGDTYRVTLNEQGEANGDGSPSLLADGSGLVVAAWAKNSANGFDVVVSRFEGGAWTAPVVIAGGASDALDPKLVLGPDGSVHMFYWVDGTVPQVFHIVAPHDLSSWSSPLLVSEGSEPSLRPAGWFHDGVLRVAYEVHNFGTGNAPREVVLARFENGAFVPEVVSITNNLGDVRPEVHSHMGRMWIDWIDHEDASHAGELAWTRLNAQGQWEPIRYEAFENLEQRGYIVRGGARMKAISGQ